MSEIMRDPSPPASIDAVAFCNFDFEDRMCDGIHQEGTGHPMIRARALEPPAWGTQHPRQWIGGLIDRVFNKQTASTQDSNGTNLQEESIFFRLPWEIRLTVYENLLCHCSIELNLAFEPRRKARVREWDVWHQTIECPTFDDEGSLLFWPKPRISRRVSYNATALKRYRKLREERKAKPKVPVSLIRTCRRIYTETIDLLYQKNTFIFRTDLLLRTMNNFLLPKHLSLISSIELIWELTHNHQPTASVRAKKSYDDLWACLKPTSLPRLRRLRVVIDPIDQNRHQTGEWFSEAWLDPVVAFASSRQLEFFEFAIPASYIECFDINAVENRKFHLRRMRDFNHRSVVSVVFRPTIRCKLSWQSFGPGAPIHSVNCPDCIDSQLDVNSPIEREWDDLSEIEAEMEREAQMSGQSRSG